MCEERTVFSRNSFGTLFRITTFGESHGVALGVVIDGCPAGLPLDLDGIRRELDRRRPGQSTLVSPRREKDEFEIISGIFEGKTTGMPITVVVRNEDVKSKDYGNIKDLFRPGHADFTYLAKYGFRDYRGGGRSSARETIGRVIGGAVAKQLLGGIGVKVFGGITQVGKVEAKRYDWGAVEQNEVRSVDPDLAPKMIEEIETARKDRDSVGAIVEVRAEGIPPGLGDPVFEKLDASIAGAMMSIPAVKGIEIGAGFKASAKRGSEMNDEFFPDGFSTNNHGGILGGISSGAPIVVRIAIKPTSSLPKVQQTIDTGYQPQPIVTKGRHDPCVGIRAVPIAEAMLALVLADAWMLQLAAKSAQSSFAEFPEVRYGMKPGE